ncbi:hypothetical protein SAMN04489740_3022 [Arthrobacter alpinus]|uniref:Uncharacterized protein n=1 Tax=Arthrobacter alpinus TaxID=656366 RepID=A0A1H5MLZ8_9MICC|nr:hypothetical protein SAMN04489740_3022 [Arthrobacter alpinus]
MFALIFHVTLGISKVANYHRYIALVKRYCTRTTRYYNTTGKSCSLNAASSAQPPSSQYPH